MPRRPANGNTRKESPNHVAGSVFTEESPLVIPKNLGYTLRNRVKEILHQNSYLDQQQVPAVVRLAKLERQFRKVEETVEKEGLVVLDRFGAAKTNPLLSTMTAIQNSIVTQERNLAIAIPARNEQIAKQDRGPRKTEATTTPQVKKGAPKLRLA
jgi:hypothetical protein